MIRRTSYVASLSAPFRVLWVGMETQSVVGTPDNLRSIVKKAESSGAPRLTNTIANGDAEKWNDIVVPAFEDFQRQLIIGLSDRPEWLAFESTEASKCTVMNSSTLTFLKPASWPLSAPSPPSVSDEEWEQRYSELKSRCVTKTGFVVPPAESYFRAALRRESIAALKKSLKRVKT